MLGRISNGEERSAPIISRTFMTSSRQHTAVAPRLRHPHTESSSPTQEKGIAAYLKIKYYLTTELTTYRRTIMTHLRQLDTDTNTNSTNNNGVLYIGAGAGVGIVLILLGIYCYRRRSTSRSSNKKYVDNDRSRLMRYPKLSSSSSAVPTGVQRNHDYNHRNGRSSSSSNNHPNHSHAVKTNRNSSNNPPTSNYNTTTTMNNNVNGAVPRVVQLSNLNTTNTNTTNNNSNNYNGMEIVRNASNVSAITMEHPHHNYYHDNDATNKYRNMNNNKDNNRSDRFSNSGNNHNNPRQHLVDLDQFNSDDDNVDNKFYFPTNVSNNNVATNNIRSNNVKNNSAWQTKKDYFYSDPEDVYPITSFDSDLEDPNIISMPYNKSNNSNNFTNVSRYSNTESQLQQQVRNGNMTTIEKPPIASNTTSTSKSSPTKTKTYTPHNLSSRKSPSLMDSDDDDDEVNVQVTKSNWKGKSAQQQIGSSRAIIGGGGGGVISSLSPQSQHSDDMEAAMNAAVFAAAAGGNVGALKAAKEIERQQARASPALSQRSNSSRATPNKKTDRKYSANGGMIEDEDIRAGDDNPWLFEAVKDTLGPRIVSADMESLGGRSNLSRGSKNSKTGGGNNSVSNRSVKSAKSGTSRQRTQRSSKKKSVMSATSSVGSNGSRKSHRSHRSTLSQMSDASRSIAADLMRLETQLAMVGAQNNNATTDSNSVHSSSKRSLGSGIYVGSQHSLSNNSSIRRKTTKRDRINVVVPPGKLGVILANKTDNRGTLVSDVRTTSVLYGKIFPGDRIVSIDNEDVSTLSVAEMTALMSRKSAYDRVLTIITSVKLNNK